MQQNLNTLDQNTLEPPFLITASSGLPKVFLGIIVCLYGILLLFLSVKAPNGFYNSPDEMANVFFVEGFVKDGYLTRPTFHDDLPSSVTPRAILRKGNSFIPVGFVSFPLVVGIIAKVVSIEGIPFLFALFSMLALLAWYGFLRSMFGLRLAIISTFLTAGYPMLIYWAQRPFFPQVLFTSFIMWALYFISRMVRASVKNLPPEVGVEFEEPTIYQPKTRRILYTFLAGLLLGTAVAFRPQEGIWLGVVFLGAILFGPLRHKFSFILFGIVGIFPIAALLVLQRMIYGSLLSTGYHLTPIGGGLTEWLRTFLRSFQFDFIKIGNVAYHYFFAFVWMYASLFVIALLVLFFKKNGGRWIKRLRKWVIGCLMLGVWFLIFYGSFPVADRFDGTPSIGTSFTRYIVPFYILTIPMIAYALFTLKRRGSSILVTFIVVLLVVSSLNLTFFKTDESLVRIVSVLKENQELQARMSAILPKDAVVLSDRSDKILFPEREVVTRFRKFHQPDFEELYGLNLYYDTIADADVVDFENKYFWGPHRLQAVNPVDLGYRHTLYKLELLESSK